MNAKAVEFAQVLGPLFAEAVLRTQFVRHLRDVGDDAVRDEDLVDLVVEIADPVPSHIQRFVVRPLDGDKPQFALCIGEVGLHVLELLQILIEIGILILCLLVDVIRDGNDLAVTHESAVHLGIGGSVDDEHLGKLLVDTHQIELCVVRLETRRTRFELGTRRLDKFLIDGASDRRAVVELFPVVAEHRDVVHNLFMPLCGRLIGRIIIGRHGPACRHRNCKDCRQSERTAQL